MRIFPFEVGNHRFPLAYWHSSSLQGTAWSWGEEDLEAGAAVCVCTCTHMSSNTARQDCGKFPQLLVGKSMEGGHR